MRWCFVIAMTGCLGRPTAQGTASDGGGSADDAAVQIDAAPDMCPWGRITDPGAFDTVPTDAMASPWLSNDHTEIRFSRYIDGDPLKSEIWRANFFSNMWHPAVRDFYDPTLSFDDVVLDPGQQVWFSQRPRDGIGPTNLVEYEPGAGSLTTLSSPTGVRQPSFTTDGALVYLASAAGTVRATLSAGNPPTITVVATLADPPGLAMSSPSIAPDGHTMFVTASTANGHRNIYQASVDGDVYSGISRLDFQGPSSEYFDPSLSSDGKTLVFASTFASPISRIYFVTRDCVP